MADGGNRPDPGSPSNAAYAFLQEQWRRQTADKLGRNYVALGLLAPLGCGLAYATIVDGKSLGASAAFAVLTLAVAVGASAVTVLLQGLASVVGDRLGHPTMTTAERLVGELRATASQLTNDLTLHREVPEAKSMPLDAMLEGATTVRVTGRHMMSAMLDWEPALASFAQRSGTSLTFYWPDPDRLKRSGFIDWLAQESPSVDEVGDAAVRRERAQWLARNLLSRLERTIARSQDLSSPTAITRSIGAEVPTFLALLIDEREVIFCAYPPYHDGNRIWPFVTFNVMTHPATVAGICKYFEDLELIADSVDKDRDTPMHVSTDTATLASESGGADD